MPAPIVIGFCGLEVSMFGLNGIVTNLPNMNGTRLRTVLVGKSPRRAGQLIVASLAASIVFYILLSHTGTVGEGIDRWLGTNYTLLVILLILVAVGVITSFSNNGMILCIIVVAIPLAGYILSRNIAFAREPTALSRVSYTVQGMVLYGVPLGIIGYLVGRGLHRLAD